jgi:hypothetical protein
MSLHALATNMASKGRNGDSMLVHMTPGEVHGLQALAMKHGGTLTTNPDTGLPEANFLKSLLPMLAGFALGPAGFGLVSSAMGAGAVVGGITGIATGSLSKGLMAGLGAYGGFGVGEALTGAGADAMTRAALSAESALPSVENIAQVTGEGYGGSAANYSDQVNAAVKSARDASAAMPKADLLSAGAKAAMADPMGFAKQNMMPLGMAAAPIMADMMVPTTTKAAPVQSPGRIVEKRWNGREFVPVASTDAGVFNTSGRTFSDLYRGYKGGGIVALAAGGDVPVPAYFLANPDVAKAFNENAGGYATGLNAQQYADLHYKTHGANEIAAGTRALAPSVDLAASAAGITPTSAMAALVANPNMRPEEFDVAASQYNLNNYNATSPLIHGYQVANDKTAAAQQYLNANPDVLAYINSQAGRDYLAANPQFDASDIAFTHFQRYGEKEGRKFGEAPAAVTTVVGGTGTGGTGTGGTGANIINATQNTGTNVTVPTDLYTAPASSLPVGVSGNTGPSQIGGGATINPNGTITTSPRIPGIPVGGFTGMQSLRDAYTKGGGSLGYTSPVPTSLDAFNKTYATDRMSGDSLAAYNYLAGKGGAKYPTKSGVGQISEDYATAVLGYPARGNLPYIYNKATGKMDVNPDYVAPGRDAAGNVTYSMSLNDVKKALTDTPMSGQALYDWAISNNLSAQQIADATGRSLSSVYSDFRAGSKAAAKKKEDDKAAGINTLIESGGGSDGGGGGGGGTGPGGVGGAGGPASTTAVGAGDIGGMDSVDAEGGYYSRGKLNYRSKDLAMGGSTGYALGGLGTLGGYSDGGRLLKGPGDGVSDSIPATIGRKQQPARLADGEFVIPARIVSELGNGSTDAGAKKLYAMMDRVQRARGKTTGKNKVAANSRADKYLPA